MSRIKNETYLIQLFFKQPHPFMHLFVVAILCIDFCSFVSFWLAQKNQNVNLQFSFVVTIFIKFLTVTSNKKMWKGKSYIFRAYDHWTLLFFIVWLVLWTYIIEIRSKAGKFSRNLKYVISLFIERFFVRLKIKNLKLENLRNVLCFYVIFSK